VEVQVRDGHDSEEKYKDGFGVFNHDNFFNAHLRESPYFEKIQNVGYKNDDFDVNHVFEFFHDLVVVFCETLAGQELVYIKNDENHNCYIH
jgi:hypothetical protein